MVFSSLFGKRPTEPEKPDTSATEPTEQKRGLFDRMRQAVTRTRESLSDSIGSVIASSQCGKLRKYSRSPEGRTFSMRNGRIGIALLTARSTSRNI